MKTGLTDYQEMQWIAAIKKYGKTIMDKSLLSCDQKELLHALAMQAMAYQKTNAH